MNIDKIVDEMKALGESLTEHSFPVVSSKDEDEISLLKTRDITIDGYTVSLHYGKSSYANHTLETVQCLGQKTPFLPFVVAAKLARKFLGDQHLCFVDIFLNNKKVYCWTLIRDLSGKPKPTEQRILKEMEFEGLKFSYLHPSSVNFL